jgi:uncharacterized BrkB/YihY/UPF0761 family membrane protein
MNCNLRIYQHEAERSHAQEVVVASIWTVLMVVMFAASLIDWPAKPIASAELQAVPAVMSSR